MWPDTCSSDSLLHTSKENANGSHLCELANFWSGQMYGVEDRSTVYYPGTKAWWKVQRVITSAMQLINLLL